MGLVLFVTLFTTRLVLNALGVEDFGIFNVVCGLVAIFGVLNTTFAGGINRYYNVAIGKGDTGDVRKIYNASLRVQSVLVLIIIVLSEIIGVWYLNTKMVIPAERMATANWIFQFSIVCLVLSIMQTPFSAAIMAYERMDYYALVSILHVVLKFACVFLLQYIQSDKLLIYGLIMLGIALTDFLLYYVYCKIKFSEFAFERKADKDSVKSLAIFSGWMLLDPLGYTAKGQGSNMVLNSFFGPTANAAFGIADQVGGAVNEFTNAISTAFKPQLIQSHSSGNVTRTLNLMCSMSKINFILSLMISVPIIFNVDFLLRIWLGEYPAIASAFVCFLLIDKTICTLNYPVTTTILAIGNIKIYMSGIFIFNLLIIPVSIVLFHFGFEAESLFKMLIIFSLLVQTFSITILKKNLIEFDVKRYCLQIIIPLLIQCISVFGLSYVASAMAEQEIWKLVLSIATSITASLVCAFLVVFTKEEKGLFINLLKNFIFKER